MGHYDFLIVGAGFFGSTFARQMTDAGYRCLVIDRRPHIAGNAFTEQIEGIHVHQYGAHIFHTNDLTIWNFVNRFAPFNHYRHKVYVNHAGRIYSFPINLMTLHQVWGVTTPLEAQQKLEQVKVACEQPANLEEWICSQVGMELYQLFVKEYTEKQWGRPATELPASIIKRLPIRTALNDFYFEDLYQGIPIGGYTQLMEKMLAGIEVRTGVDFFEQRSVWEGLASHIVFTGRIDEFFDYRFGELSYRSLHFEKEVIPLPDFQGTSVVNYTEGKMPYTRILEHKHFDFGKGDVTVITREFPQSWFRGREPYYPINDRENNKRYQQYAALSREFPHVIFGGRLGEYRYYDMHQVVGSALAKSKAWLKGRPC